MPTTNLAGLVAPQSHASLMILAAFQQDSINSGNSKLLMFFIGVVAVALIIQAAVMLGAAFAAIKAQKSLTVELHEFRNKAAQLMDKSDALITELTPQIRNITAKVDIITGHVEHLAALVHEKADEFSPTISAANQTVAAANQTVQDANLKTRAQITRVNGMVTSTLDATARLGVAIERGIAKPGRELAGIVSGLKVGFETLLSGARAFGSGAPVGRTVYPRTVNQPPTTPPRPTYPYPPSKPDLDL
jgi:uncharacterized protein YoxC